MYISDELMDFFNGRRDTGIKAKRRGFVVKDVDERVLIFLHYFGFLQADWPSEEETGTQFNPKKDVLFWKKKNIFHAAQTRMGF